MIIRTIPPEPTWLRRIMLAVGVIFATTTAADAGWLEQTAHFVSPEWRRLEDERALQESLLATLPPAPAVHNTERLGYHSGYSTSPESVEWVEMDLEREEPIDAIVLIAAPSNSGGSAPAGYGFPLRFRVEVRGGGEADARHVVADFTQHDFPNPGALPVYIPTPGRKARSVRITATRLFREENRYLLALGEVMIFQGQYNLAARLKRVDRTVSRTTGAVPVWGTVNMADGHTVLGPPVGTKPSPTLGYQSRLVNLNRDPDPAPRWVQVDLGRPMAVDEVRVFPAHPPEFAHRPGFGFPLEWKVEVSNEADFHEAIPLRDFDDDAPHGMRLSVSPGDNVATFFGRGDAARYVRFTALQLFNANGQYNFALAEMQVWSGGINVALGRPVTAYDSLESRGWSAAALVDGYNSQFNILDWPGWLAGLSQRREAEQRLAALEVRRTAVIRRLEKVGWWSLAAVVAALLLTLFASMWRQRRMRRAEMEALRQRIARDLHDEIGSSLGSIALISQDVIAVADDPAQVRRELAEIQGIARQTVDSMRDIARLVQSETYGQGDLSAHLREIADRMLRNLPHTLRLAEGDFSRLVAVDRQRDLVLIFKETLHNILKHAQATQVDIELTHARESLTLVVHDNGRGFEAGAAPRPGGMGLTNLRRRAEKHGGEVRIASSVGGGTTVTISLPDHE